MKDGIIKGTGDSRYLKGAGWPSTYAEFKAMAEAGTLPFDLNGVNAEGWQQIGDALNKANLLSDATAAKLNGVETPNAAFDLLSRFHAGLGNDYVWKKYIGNYTFVNGKQDSITEGGTTTVWYSSSVSVNANHEIALGAPVSTGTLSSVKSILPGKYVKLNAETNPVYYFVSSSGSSSVSVIYRPVSFVYSESNISYVNSPTSNAYPPSVSDGYTYTALGQIGNKANITSFSYVGTGGDKTITMPFPIKCAIVQTLPRNDGDKGMHSFMVAIQWQNYVWTSTYSNSSPDTVTWTENSFTTNSRNASGKTYFVVVFG